MGCCFSDPAKEIHTAVATGDAKLLKSTINRLSKNQPQLLLDIVHDAHPDIPTGGSLLHAAVYFDKIEIFEMLIWDVDPRLLRTTDRQGNTPIHIAVANYGAHVLFSTTEFFIPVAMVYDPEILHNVVPSPKSSPRGSKNASPDTSSNRNKVDGGDAFVTVVNQPQLNQPTGLGYFEKQQQLEEHREDYFKERVLHAGKETIKRIASGEYRKLTVVGSEDFTLAQRGQLLCDTLRMVNVDQCTAFATCDALATATQQQPKGGMMSNGLHNGGFGMIGATTQRYLQHHRITGCMGRLGIRLTRNNQHLVLKVIRSYLNALLSLAQKRGLRVPLLTVNLAVQIASQPNSARKSESGVTSANTSTPSMFSAVPSSTSNGGAKPWRQDNDATADENAGVVTLSSPETNNSDLVDGFKFFYTRDILNSKKKANNEAAAVEVLQRLLCPFEGVTSPFEASVTGKNGGAIADIAFHIGLSPRRLYAPISVFVDHTPREMTVRRVKSIRHGLERISMRGSVSNSGVGANNMHTTLNSDFNSVNSTSGYGFGSSNHQQVPVVAAGGGSQWQGGQSLVSSDSNNMLSAGAMGSPRALPVAHQRHPALSVSTDNGGSTNSIVAGTNSRHLGVMSTSKVQIVVPTTDRDDDNDEIEDGVGQSSSNSQKVVPVTIENEEDIFTPPQEVMSAAGGSHGPSNPMLFSSSTNSGSAVQTRNPLAGNMGVSSNSASGAVDSDPSRSGDQHQQDVGAHHSDSDCYTDDTNSTVHGSGTNDPAGERMTNLPLALPAMLQQQGKNSNAAVAAAGSATPTSASNLASNSETPAAQKMRPLTEAERSLSSGADQDSHTRRSNHQMVPVDGLVNVESTASTTGIGENTDESAVTARVGAPDPTYTPIYTAIPALVAITSNNLAALKELLRIGGKTQLLFVDSSGNNALHCAVRTLLDFGDSSVLDYLCIDNETATRPLVFQTNNQGLRPGELEVVFTPARSLGGGGGASAGGAGGMSVTSMSGASFVGCLYQEGPASGGRSGLSSAAVSANAEHTLLATPQHPPATGSNQPLANIPDAFEADAHNSDAGSPLPQRRGSSNGDTSHHSPAASGVPASASTTTYQRNTVLMDFSKWRSKTEAVDKLSVHHASFLKVGGGPPPAGASSSSGKKKIGGGQPLQQAAKHD